MNARSSLRVFKCTSRLHCQLPRRQFATAVADGPSVDRATIVEVGPRDGLQNEKNAIPVETKIELIERLGRTGIEIIEAGSFVSPKWVPQMANSDQILTHLLKAKPNASHPTYQFLVPNAKGLDNFLSTYEQTAGKPQSAAVDGESAPHEVSIFAAATESFSKKNINCSIAESLERFKPVFAKAKASNVPVRAYISVALGCPYEGPDVDPKRVADLAVDLLELGASEISIGDTTGMGTVTSTKKLFKTLAAAGIEMQDVALHCHDTYGQALVNILVGLEAGVRVFDSAVGGLGGCPYSPGATGNVATEDLVYLLESLGVSTGIDLAAVSEIGDWITKEVGKKNESRAGKALLAKVKKQQGN